MARLTFDGPVNVRWQGNVFHGPAGTEFTLDDSLVDEFVASFVSGSGRRLPAITWIETDEIGDLDARLTIIEESGGGDHPSLAVHDTMGLATQAELDTHEGAVDPHTVYALDADLTSHVGAADPHPGYASDSDLANHEAAADPHAAYALDSDLTAHAGAADPHVGYQLESEKGVANGYASLDVGGTVPDGQIPSTIARDSELPDLAGHEAAADPHTGYVREADANWVDLTDAGETTLHTHPAGAGAPTDADYLVGTAHAGLSAEIVVGTSPGGELGGSWGSPTVDASHSGSTHAATQAAAEATAQVALDVHLNDAADAHDASAISILDTAADFTATDVEGALAELQADNEAHVAAADPHAGYRLETADHTHASSGAQAGQVAHSALSGIGADDHHAQLHVAAHASGGADAILTETAPSTQAFGDSPAQGADATKAAKIGHKHGMPVDPVTAHVAAGDPHTVYLLESVPIARGGTVYDPAGVAVVNLIVWRAPFACTVTNVRGYRVGGTGATINARKNGTLNHLSSALSLTGADSWTDGGAVQNTSYSAGDKLEIMVVSATGSPTQIGVQVDFTRA